MGEKTPEESKLAEELANLSTIDLASSIMVLRQELQRRALSGDFLASVLILRWSGTVASPFMEEEEEKKAPDPPRPNPALERARAFQAQKEGKKSS